MVSAHKPLVSGILRFVRAPLLVFLGWVALGTRVAFIWLPLAPILIASMAVLFLYLPVRAGCGLAVACSQPLRAGRGRLFLESVSLLLAWGIVAEGFRVVDWARGFP